MGKKESLDFTKLLLAMENEQTPVGAVYLSHVLHVPPATIGRLMKVAEDRKLIQSISNKGRCITEQGRQYLRREAMKETKSKIADEIIDTTQSTQVQSLEEILTVRFLLESYTVREACKNITEEDLQELEYLTYEQQYKVRNGDIGSEADLQYHLKVAELSHNNTILRLLKLILTENGVYQTFTHITNVMHLQKISNHIAITEALKERNPDKAEKAMQQHLKLLMEHTRNYADKKSAINK